MTNAQRKHGIIRIARSGVFGEDGVDTNLTAFLVEAKRRGVHKVIDVGADEDRNEHLIKVMRPREGEELPTAAPAADAAPHVTDESAPTPEQALAMRKAFDAMMTGASQPNDIERQRAKHDAQPGRYQYMRVLAGPGGEERRSQVLRDARRQGIKVVDCRLDEERGHWVIRALVNQRPQRRKRRR